MCNVGIIADDLTGALDAAAPFASCEDPVLVSWGDEPPMATGFAVDSETRQASAAEAAQKVASLLPRLTPCGIAFKKIDSLMRGNTIPELLACCREAAFRTVVIAPAFPQQGRVTRQGRQYALSNGAEQWRRLEADIPASLARRGVSRRVIARGAELSGDGVLVCDADSDGDLAAIAASAARLAPPVLWCGTAGLARAFGGASATAGAVEGSPKLAIIGSRHPATARQTVRLQALLGKIAWVRNAADPETAVAAVRQLLGREGRAALAFGMPTLSPDEAADVFRRTFAALARIAAPEVIVVVGGDTIFRLCREAGATRLATIGEYSPGIAVSRFLDGAWAGTRVVSKSGAFGDDEMLARIMAR